MILGAQFHFPADQRPILDALCSRSFRRCGGEIGAPCEADAARRHHKGDLTRRRQAYEDVFVAFFKMEPLVTDDVALEAKRRGSNMGRQRLAGCVTSTDNGATITCFVDGCACGWDVLHSEAMRWPSAW